MRTWRLLLFAALFCLAALVLERPAATAQEALRSADGQVLKFRRIYAPEDRVQDWPRGNVRYLPIEPAEFEELIATIRSVPSAADTSAAASLAEAQFSARLAGDTLLGDDSSILVEHAVDDPALVSLDPCNLAIDSAQWQSTQSPAMVGLDGTGRLAVLIPRSDTLQLGWSLRGVRDASGTLTFNLRLPRCPATTLQIDLPAEMVLLADRGVVTSRVVDEPEPTAVDNDSDDVPTADAAEQPAPATWRRWRVVLGGHSQVTLEIAPRRRAGQPNEPLLRETITYEVSPRAVDVTAQLRLDIPHDPLRSLPILLDAGLQLISVRYGEVDLSWSAAGTRDDGRQRVEIALPEPLRGTGRLLRLTAICPLVTDRPWQLPRIRPQGVFWQEGTSTLLVPEPLTLERIEPVDCRQSKTGPLPWPLAGDSIELQHFSPDSGVQVVISRQQEPVQLTSATSVELGGPRMTARFAGRFDLPAGQRFVLRGEVPEAWIIDSVETQPPELRGDWSVNEAQAGSRQLTVRLTDALSAERSVQMTVTAHAARMQPQARYSAERLQMLRFPGMSVQEQLLAVHTLPPYRMQLHDATQLERLDRSRLSAATSALLPETPYDLLVSAGESAWSLSIDEEKPRYHAEVKAIATAEEEELTERYRVVCEPESTAVQRVLVQFTQAGEEELHWTLGGQVRGQLVARRLPLAAGSPWPDGELWEITLLEASPEPFELEASRRRLLEPDEDASISLPILPEAATQEVTVVVEASGDTPLAIAGSQQLSPIPMALVQEQIGNLRSIRAAFRYERLPAGTGATPPLVVRRPSGDEAHAGAIVWSCRVESRYQPQGIAWHQAVCRVENLGRNTCTLNLPESAELLGIWLNGDELTLDQRDHEVVLDLPPTRRFNNVTLSFQTEESALGVVHHGEPPHLSWDVPVLSQRWTVWLPAGYEMLSPSGSWQSLHAPRPTWSQRLFGPLSRSRQQAPFELFNVSQWNTLTGEAANRSQALEQHVRGFCEQLALGLAYAQPQRGDRLRWGDLLSVAASPATGWSDRLLIDGDALADAGIAPTTPIGDTSYAQPDDPFLKAVALLEQNGLTLIVESDTVLLSTGTAAAVAGSQLQPLSVLIASEVMPGSLATQLSTARTRQSTRFVPVSAWIAQPVSPWTPSRDLQRSSRAFVRWNAWQLDSASSHAVSAWIVRMTTVQALGGALGLLVFAVLWWRLRQRLGWLLVCLGVAAMAALLAPMALVPITSSMVLGSLGAVAAALLLPALPRPGKLKTSHTTITRGTPAMQAGMIALGVLVTLLLLARFVAAQQTQAVADSSDQVYQVFIPSDEAGQPTGGRYLVPEEFYTRLRQQAAESAEAPRDWLIRAARYEATLARDILSTNLSVVDGWATFDLHVFADGAVVEIPLHAANSGVIVESAVLNDRAAEAALNDDGTALLCEVPQAGYSRLRVALRPPVTSGDESSGFEFAIPRVPHATLELTAPADVPQVDVPTAAGNITPGVDQQPLTAQLGPTDRLAVRWSDRAMRQMLRSADVDELLWLKIHSGTIVVDAQFQVTVLSGQLDSLQVAASPRLRLLPQAERDPLIAEIESEPADPQEPGSRQVFTFHFSRPVTDEATVRASFLLSGGSGIGRVRLPQMEVLALRTLSRKLAVSVDPLLDFEVAGAEKLSALAVPEFANAWRAADALPQLAFQLPIEPVPWELAVRPKPPHNKATQLRQLAFDARRIDVRLLAEIETTEGYVFQHRVLAPPELRIDSLSLLEDGAERLDRWTRDESGTINVFLTGPASGPQQLSLRGSLPAVAPGEVALPSVRLSNVELARDAVQLYRRPGVLVEVKQMEGFSDTTEPLPSGSEELGRPVAAWQATKPDAHAVVALSPNDPQVSVVQLTSLARDEQSWIVELDCRWKVTQGRLDMLQLQIPPDLAGPFEIAPAMSGQLVQTPGQDTRLLLLRPRTAIDGELRLLVRGRLNLSAGQSVGTPNIIPLGAQRLERYLRLPTQLGLEQVEWQPTDMERARLPEEFSFSALGRQAFVIYRVTGEHPRATLRAVERGAAVAEIAMADYQVAWQGDGEYQAIATFDLDPAGLKSCVLEMPEGATLRQLSIAGVPLTATRLGDNRWRVPLLFEQLPARVELLYVGTVPEVDQLWDGVHLSAPRMVDVPVKQTLWSVYGPPSSGPGEAEEARSTSLVRQEMLRLKHLTAVLSPDAELASLVPPDTLAQWYREWLHRWMACRASIRQQLLEAPQTSDTLAAEAEAAALERELARSAQQLNMTEILVQQEAAVARADRPSELWRAAFQGTRPITRCSFEQPVHSLTVRYPAAESADFFWRLAVCGLGLSVVLLAWRPLSRLDVLRRWPHVFGVLAGLAWWLWLWPSALGWLIVAVSLAASLFSGLRTVGEPASTVVRLGTSNSR